MNARRHPWDDLSDAEIDGIAAASTEFPEITDDDLRRAVAVSAAGRVKVPISIRVDEEALDFFRAQGSGYQTRINDVLLRYARGELRSAADAGPGRGGARVRRVVTARAPAPRVSLARAADGGAQPGTPRSR